MYAGIIQEAGLSLNEARIYETLLREGTLSIGQIAVKSHVHRRNVYDTIKKLLNAGLVFEILASKERVYQAVEPARLNALLETKMKRLEQVMPALEELYRTPQREQQVYIYRGPEGWKNYMRDMLRIGEDAYFIAAKGAWLDERVRHFFPYFEKEAAKRSLRYYHLFDWEVQDEVPQILTRVGEDYKFLPRGYSSPGAVDLFGDRVNLLHDIKLGSHGSEIRFIVIVNRDIAEAFRRWFWLMWEICPG